MITPTTPPSPPRFPASGQAVTLVTLRVFVIAERGTIARSNNRKRRVARIPLWYPGLGFFRVSPRFRADLRVLLFALGFASSFQIFCRREYQHTLQTFPEVRPEVAEVAGDEVRGLGL